MADDSPTRPGNTPIPPGLGIAVDTGKSLPGSSDQPRLDLVARLEHQISNLEQRQDFQHGEMQSEMHAVTDQLSQSQADFMAEQRDLMADVGRMFESMSRHTPTA